ncbi:MAG: translation initiation factor 2 [Oscillospiraceae bacterium]|nr:translation initiation factor 2 [Oscillospiraceae bacterium]MBP3521277.1 translation initiation factor 2 [Oscillospiraceae bacterium]
MIKGISRRVIVVKAPDRRFFEEAIFIVREDILGQGGVTADQVVEEARRVADGYARKKRRTWREWLPALGYMALGAGLTTAVWCAGLFL